MEAVENVINKKINSYQASERYNIPRSTIIHRVYGTRGAKKPTPGRPTELSTAWESRVAALLHEMEKCEFPLTSKEIKELICVYIQKNGLITRFKDDYPGKEWFRGFKRRHRLSVKKPQSVEVARKKASNPFILNNYFDLLERITKELELEDKPQHIYNLDETSFCSDPTKTKVVGLKGYPSTRTTASPGRNNTTVLLASNALGKKIPPLIVFQGKQLWSNCFFENENVNTAYASSRKGWMETKIFENYIKKVFIPAIGPERPVLLIFDGHSTHVDLSVIELLMANQITVLKLPAHSSHILQPLDCSTMKPMKDNWDSELVKWQRLHVGAKLSKSEFARIITKIWNDLNPVIIQNGFRKSGIYPLNRDEIKIIRQQKDRERTNEDRNEVGNEDRQKDRKGKNEDGNEEPPTLMSMCTSMLLKIFNRGKKEILIEDLPKRVKDPSKFIISVSQNTNSSSTKSGSSNVKILSNIELTPTSYQKEKNERISFEELLLETISRSNIPKTSRKCVSKEAEILTYKEAIDRMRKKKDEKEKAEEIKRLNKLKKQQERKDKNKTKKEVQMKININGNKESQCKKDNQVKKRTIWKAKKKRRDSTSSSEDEGEIIYNDESDLDAEEFLEQLKNEDDEEEIIVGIKEESEKGITHDDRKNNNTRQITEEREQGCFLIGEEKLNKNKKRLKQLDKKNENEAILNNKKQKKIQNTISENRTHKKEKQKGKNTAKISNKKKYRKKSIDVSSNSSGSYQSLDESDCEDMDTFFEEILENERDSLVELASKSKNSVSTKSVRTAVKEGRFVLAKFHSSKGKKTFQYVCRIEHINSKKIVVQGFHSYNKSKKKFRVIENDTSIIEEHEIINYLPDPVINGKDYIFPNDVDIIEFK